MTKKKSFVFFRVGVDSIQKKPIFVQQQRGTIPQQQTPERAKRKGLQYDNDNNTNNKRERFGRSPQLCENHTPEVCRVDVSKRI